MVSLNWSDSRPCFLQVQCNSCQRHHHTRQRLHFFFFRCQSVWCSKQFLFFITTHNWTFTLLTSRAKLYRLRYTVTVHITYSSTAKWLNATSKLQPFNRQKKKIEWISGSSRGVKGSCAARSKSQNVALGNSYHLLSHRKIAWVEIPWNFFSLRYGQDDSGINLPNFAFPFGCTPFQFHEFAS